MNTAHWKMYLAIAIVSAITIGLGYYSYISPNVALENIRKAAHENDRVRLRELIDFESVKTGLKEDIKAQIMTSSGDSLKDNPFAPLGFALTSMAVDPLVETIISPAGLTQLFESGAIASMEGSTENFPSSVEK